MLADLAYRQPWALFSALLHGHATPRSPRSAEVAARDRDVVIQRPWRTKSGTFPNQDHASFCARSPPAAPPPPHLESRCFLFFQNANPGILARPPLRSKDKKLRGGGNWPGLRVPRFVHIMKGSILDGRRSLTLDDGGRTDCQQKNRPTLKYQNGPPLSEGDQEAARPGGLRGGNRHVCHPHRVSRQRLTREIGTSTSQEVGQMQVQPSQQRHFVVCYSQYGPHTTQRPASHLLVRLPGSERCPPSEPTEVKLAAGGTDPLGQLGDAGQP